MTRFVFVAVLAALSGCRSASELAASADVRALEPTTIELRAGETRAVQGVRIDFGRVESDSRCPSTVTCVWAGNAAVELQVSGAAGGGPSRRLVLNTGLDPKDGEALGLRITLLALTPYPEVPGAIDGEAYRVRLDVRGADFVAR
ncbi:MAG: hypothetical protein AB7R55_01940 [Gemmatimonadales bacterium]